VARHLSRRRGIRLKRVITFPTPVKSFHALHTATDGSNEKAPPAQCRWGLVVSQGWLGGVLHLQRASFSIFGAVTPAIPLNTKRPVFDTLLAQREAIATRRLTLEH